MKKLILLGAGVASVAEIATTFLAYPTTANVVAPILIVGAAAICWGIFSAARFPSTPTARGMVAVVISIVSWGVGMVIALNRYGS